MAWKETPRAAATMIRRRYKCDVCEGVFEERVASSDAPIPDCPTCVKAVAGGALVWQAPLPAIGTTKGAAMDLAQKVIEEDWGLSNFQDNQRPGDIGFKADTGPTTQELEAEVRQWAEMAQAVATQLPQSPTQAPPGTPDLLVNPREQVANYWQGTQGSTVADQSIGASPVAREASQQQAREGVDAVGLLERGRESGNMRMRMNVVSAMSPEDVKAAAGG